jgi:hypothetical protein
MATQYSNKPIVTDGLVYALDFGNPKSYVSGSTTANSLKYETNLTSVTGSTSIPNLQNGVLFFTGSQWVERTGSFNVFNPNGAFTLSIVVNSRTAGTLVSQTSSLGNLTSNVSPTSSAFGFINPNYNREIQGLSLTQLNHLTYRYSSGSLDIFYNGTLVTASQATISLPTSSVVDEFYINGNNGLLNNFSGSLAAISVYNRALTINEVQSNYTIARTRYGLTQEQNYTLDENAFLFLQSAGITDPIITGSIDTFVRGLKSNNLWDKMIAIYPFVGTGSVGTNLTGSHRWNLKEPSLVTYPLTFTGSWIGSTSGSAPSGSNTNISTQVTPSNYYPFYNTQSAHISILSYDTPVSSSYLMGTGMTEDLAISTLAGDYGTPAAAYSVRKVRTAYSGALMDVRRDYDNVTSSIGFASNGDLDTGSLLDWVVPGRNDLPGEYDGLAAAYSLRKVSASYSGDAIEVRRDWDNESGSFGFDANGDLDTVSLLTFVTGSAGTGSGFVQTWYDQSGNGRHATQTATGSQPLIVSSGSLITENGKPSIYFGWAGEEATVRLQTNTFTPITQPYSVFTSFATNTNDRQCFFDGGTTNNQIAFISDWWMVNDGTGYGTSSTSMKLHSNFFNQSTNFSAAENGGTLATLQNHSTTLDGITLGHLRNAFAPNYQFNGNISECIVYSADQATNRTLIENNINNYYNIYTGSNHGFVARWYDQSGNNRHATQTATGSQPLIVESGSLITENSKPTLLFDGVNDQLDTPIVPLKYITTVVNPTTASGQYEVFVSYGVNINVLQRSITGTSFTTSDTLFNPMNFYVNNRRTNTFINSSIQLWDVGGDNPQANNRGIQMGKSLLGAYASMNMSELIAYPDNQEFTNRQPISYGINNYYNIYPQTSSFTTSSFTIQAGPTSVSASLNNRLTSGISTSGPLGLITVSRTGSNSLTIARNGVTSSFTVPASGALSTGIYLGAINNNGLALGNSPLNISFASVGTGLTGIESTRYFNLVNSLNYRLGRAVNAEYQAVLEYAILQGYTLPSVEVQAAQNQLLSDLKSAGIWNKLDTFFLCASDGDLNFAFLNWKSLGVNSLTTGTSTSTILDPNKGFRKTSSTDSGAITGPLFTTTTAVNVTTSSAAVYVYEYEHVAGITIFVGFNNLTRMRYRNGSINDQTIGGATPSAPLSMNVTSFPALKSIQFTSPSTITFTNNATQYPHSTVSTAINIPSTNNVSFYPGSNVYGTISLFAYGASLLDENTAFSNAMSSYFTAISS